MAIELPDLSKLADLPASAGDPKNSSPNCTST